MSLLYIFTVSNVLWSYVRAVTFRQFVANLLYNLQRMPSLSALYRELSDVVIRYDDCILTCSIPFTRRRRPGQHISDVLIRTNVRASCGLLRPMVLWR